MFSMLPFNISHTLVIGRDNHDSSEEENKNLKIWTKGLTES